MNEKTSERFLCTCERAPEPGTTIKYADQHVVITHLGRSWYMDGEDADGLYSPEFWDEYVCYAYYRAANTDEIAAFTQAQLARAIIKVARSKIDDFIRTTRSITHHAGFNSDGDRINVPEGLSLHFNTSSSIYGTETYLHITPSHVWVIEQNSADGDNWSHSNSDKGIAYRRARTPELDTELQSQFQHGYDITTPWPTWEATAVVDHERVAQSQSLLREHIEGLLQVDDSYEWLSAPHRTPRKFTKLFEVYASRQNVLELDGTLEVAEYRHQKIFKYKYQYFMTQETLNLLAVERFEAAKNYSNNTQIHFALDALATTDSHSDYYVWEKALNNTLGAAKLVTDLVALRHVLPDSTYNREHKVLYDTYPELRQVLPDEASIAQHDHQSKPEKIQLRDGEILTLDAMGWLTQPDHQQKAKLQDQAWANIFKDDPTIRACKDRTGQAVQQLLPVDAWTQVAIIHHQAEILVESQVTKYGTVWRTSRYTRFNAGRPIFEKIYANPQTVGALFYHGHNKQTILPYTLQMLARSIAPTYELGDEKEIFQAQAVIEYLGGQAKVSQEMQALAPFTMNKPEGWFLNEQNKLQTLGIEINFVTDMSTDLGDDKIELYHARRVIEINQTSHAQLFDGRFASRPKNSRTDTTGDFPKPKPIWTLTTDPDVISLFDQPEPS